MSSSEPSSVTALGALDRAFSLSMRGEHELALATAARLLEDAPANPGALFVAARALGLLAQAQVSQAAFDLAIQRAIRAGNFPLAVAACFELTDVGESADGYLRQIAETFCAGSENLTEHRAPPDMLLSVAAPAAYEQRGAELISQSERVIEKCKQLLEGEREQAPKVAPQVPFSALSAESLQALAAAFEGLTVDTGHVLIEEGTMGSEAFILARGELEVQRRARDSDQEPTSLARLGTGALFGEMSLLSRSPRAASVVACRPSVVLRISKEALDEVAQAQPSVGHVLAQFTRQRMIDNLVRTSSILSVVRSTRRNALLERFVTKTFEAGERVITQGEESSGLYLVASGSLSVMHRGEEEQLAISKLGPGEVVGEVALILRRPSNADVIAEHPTVTLHLPRDQFLDLVKAHPEVLPKLYELAVERDEETRSLVAQEATEADDFILL